MCLCASTKTVYFKSLHRSSNTLRNTSTYFLSVLLPLHFYVTSLTSTNQMLCNNMRHSNQSTSLWLQRCGYKSLLYSWAKICCCSMEEAHSFLLLQGQLSNHTPVMPRLWHGVMDESVQFPEGLVGPALCVPGYNCRTRAWSLLRSLKNISWFTIAELAAPLVIKAWCILRPPCHQ